MKIDIYKSIFLLILGVFVYCYFENNKNHRYNKISERNDGGYDDLLILDTKSGATYLIDYDGDGKIKLNSPSIIK